MPAGAQDAVSPIRPKERLDVAAVRPTTSDPLGWTGVRVEHLSDPPATEVDLPPLTQHWLFLNHRPAPGPQTLQQAIEDHALSLAVQKIGPSPGAVVAAPATTAASFCSSSRTCPSLP